MKGTSLFDEHCSCNPCSPVVLDLTAQRSFHRCSQPRAFYAKQDDPAQYSQYSSQASHPFERCFCLPCVCCAGVLRKDSFPHSRIFQSPSSMRTLQHTISDTVLQPFVLARAPITGQKKPTPQSPHGQRVIRENCARCSLLLLAGEKWPDNF